VRTRDKLERRPRELVLVMVSVVALVAGVIVSTVPAGAIVPRPQVLIANTGAAAGTNVTLSPRALVLSPSMVSSSLVAVSADGSTYTFSTDKGPLAQVAPGKVLLLEGRDAVVVTSVKRVGGKLIVGAAPASLTDVVSSGHIAVSGPPDTGAAIGVPLSTASFAGSTALSARSTALSAGSTALSAGPSSPSARPQLAGAPAALTGSNTFSYKGTSGGFTYKVGFSGMPGGLKAVGEFCYQLVGSASGKSCGNGLSISATLNGVFTWANEDLNLGVSGGSVSSGSFSISGMSSNLTLEYAVVRGAEPTVGAKPPVLKIPFAFEAPLCGTPLGCAGLPLYSKFQLALLITLGISAKDSTIQGGVQVTISGSGTVSGSKIGGVAGSVTNGHVKGSFTTGTALTPGAAGVEVALQNKFGVGLGIKGINGLYYISAITAVGETTGSLVAGESCKAFVGSFTITGNFEAQLFGFTVSSPAKDLFNKKASFKQPPC
jgi:hypothetical protein